MAWLRANWRRLIWPALVLLVVAALLVRGCMAEKDARTGPAPAPAVEVEPEPLAELTILSPRAGAKVEQAGGVAVVHVKGRAEPGREVLVRSDGCGAGCQERALVADGGGWSARVVAPPSPDGELVLRASYADGAGAGQGASVKLRAVRGAAGAPRVASDRDSLSLVGDSLAVGMEGPLPRQLGGWKVTVDGKIGRSLAAGMGIIGAMDLPPADSSVLAVSLFTNDSPGNTAALRSAAESALAQVGEQGCVVWGAVVAPPIGGVSYAAANRTLRQLASEHDNFKVVAWDRLAAREPSLLEPDRVHPTAAGYAALARLYARAARSCE